MKSRRDILKLGFAITIGLCINNPLSLLGDETCENRITVPTYTALGGSAKNAVDLSIVHIRNAYPWQSCFVGTGVSGCQIAKRLSEEYYFIGNHSSTTVLNVTDQSGESSKVIKQILPHVQDRALVIISGSINDPEFLSLRKMVLLSSPMFLWTILESQKSITDHTASIQPRTNESVTVIPPGTDYIKRSLVLIQTLTHVLHEPGLAGIAFGDDVMGMYAGHWTKIMDVETNDQCYGDDIRRFIMYNITHLQNAGSASLIIFGDPSLNNSILHTIPNLFNDSMTPDSSLVFGAYIVEEFASKLHVAIIMDDKLIQNRIN